MKKEIISLIIQIIVSIAVLFISIPMWEKMNNDSEYLNKAIALNSLSLEAKNKVNILNQKAIYEVKNNSDLNTSGYLYLKINKNSLIDYHLVNIKVNNYETALSNLYSKEDNTYNYFLLNSFNLNGNENKLYNIKLNISEEDMVLMDGKTLNYNLSVITNQENI